MAIALVFAEPAGADPPVPVAAAAHSLSEKWITSAHVDSGGSAILLSASGIAPSLRLDDAVRSILASDWSVRFGTRAQGAEEAGPALQRLLLDPSDLSARPAARMALLRGLGAAHLVLVSHSSSAMVLRLDAEAYSANTSGPDAKEEVVVPKTREVRAYLGEALPGELVVDAPEDAQVSIDEEPVPTRIERGWRADIDPGRHRLRVEMSGYFPYETEFGIGTGESIHMQTAVKNSATAPAKSLLMSAVIPGLPLLFYARPHAQGSGRAWPEAMVGTGAGFFYAGAVLWSIDQFGVKDKFVTDQSASRHRSIKRAELGVAAVGYLLNVIGATALGSEYASRNRQITRLALDVSAPHCHVEPLGQSVPRTPIPDEPGGLCVSCRWAF